MKKRIILSVLLCLCFLTGLILPEGPVIPVAGATSKDWHKDTFWYEPWGTSGVHKGIDIFASKGTDLVSSTPGIVLFAGELSKGGKVVLVMGPKWRFHYYAHLDSLAVNNFTLLGSSQKLGTVGDSGNAKGKPAHLHYSIVTALPYLWKFTTETQGWKKMFFLDPGAFLTSGL